MGNCIAEEEIGMHKRGSDMHAVGANIDTIESTMLQAFNQNADLKQRLILKISCSDLPRMDKRSQTDAFCVLWQLKGKNQHQKQMIAKTEILYDSANPDFVQALEVDFYFEKNDKYMMTVYDVDDENQINNLQKQEFIGSDTFSLHNIVSARNQTYEAELKHPVRGSNGKIKIIGEEKKADYGKTQCRFSMVVAKVDTSDFVFITIAKHMGKPGEFKPVYKSECKETERSAFRFNQVISDTDTLANSDPDCEMMFTSWKYSSSGKHKKIQAWSIDYSKLQACQDFTVAESNGNITIKWIKLKKQESVLEKESFLDYILGGCQIGLQIAIDFTASNKEARDPNSLHNKDENRNPYIRAIRSIGAILQNYDNDQKFPVYGFGGKDPSTGQVSHCFALNGNIYAPEVYSVEGVVNVYKNAIQKCDLFGPTMFSELLHQMNAFCAAKTMEESQYNQKYNIMVILTDGVINDKDATIREIVNASEQPLSVIIIGVGDADFTQMEELDADKRPLYNIITKKYQSRDIVQFVPFNQYQHDPSLLAKQVLREIPRQMIQYFQSKNIKPNPPCPQLRAQQLANANLTLTDSYFFMRREKAIQHLQKQYIPADQAADFIDTKSIAFDDFNTLQTKAEDPSYVNYLRMF